MPGGTAALGIPGAVGVLVLRTRAPAKLLARALQTVHHKAFLRLHKDIRGFVQHMFVLETGVLVIASSDRQDPIPVISRDMGQIMIKRGHDSISTLHSGGKILRYWLIERCWWWGMTTDVANHISTCLTCQRMKFAASPGYGFQQMRWWDSPGKMICIDIVVLQGKHKSSQGTRSIFTSSRST